MPDLDLIKQGEQGVVRGVFRPVRCVCYIIPEFCSDAGTLQTTWLRNCPSPRQRRPRLSRRISITLSS